MTSETDNKGLTTKKDENFSEWFSQILDKAELVDLRLDIKGFMVIRPWAAMIIENMYKLYENELQKNRHKPTFMPSLISEENLKKELTHVKGFTPEVFWLKEINKEKLALRPTSETLYTPMFKLWVRSYRDLPLKLYQRGSVFRLDTKATRPLIRTREILWIEAHDAFATKQEAEKQVIEDIETTEKIMHKQFGIPFLPMKRPSWDKFAGAEYTIGSDVIMPDGKLIQQPSTHFMGQRFSKAFDAKFKNEKGKEEFLWTTAYGPAMSRILVSIISTHGDDSGLILPSLLSPIQIILIPIFKKENKEKIIKELNYTKEKLEKLGLRIKVDNSEKSPGEKFNIWELRGVPLRLEIGKEEILNKELTVFIRDTKKKEKIKSKDLPELKKMLKDYDKRIFAKADKILQNIIVNCKTKKEIKDALNNKKIARINFCSVDERGIKCAEIIEKEFGAEVRGTIANKKEKTFGKCLICGNSANEIVYLGRSY